MLKLTLDLLKVVKYLRRNSIKSQIIASPHKTTIFLMFHDIYENKETFSLTIRIFKLFSAIAIIIPNGSNHFFNFKMSKLLPSQFSLLQHSSSIFLLKITSDSELGKLFVIFPGILH